jgi:hypothetical protein
MAEWGAINPADTGLIKHADTPEHAFQILKDHLSEHHLQKPLPKKTPQLARTRS